MNVFNVFFPHLLYILGAIACFFIFIFPITVLGGLISVYIFHKASAHRDKMAEPSTLLGLSKNCMMKLFFILGIVIVLLVYTWVFLSFSDSWIRAKPSESWESDIKTVGTAIILGFGYTIGKNGQMQAGEANEFLWDWTLKHTTADTILVQEGVWVAVCPGSDKNCQVSGRELYRIHRDDRQIDVNTLEMAFCAMQRMEQLGKTKAVIVAHDLQLERAAWDFEKVKRSRKNWRHFKFIVPKIPGTPFPEDSHQKRTRSRLYYKFVELFLSRVRDFLSSTPERCIAPTG